MLYISKWYTVNSREDSAHHKGKGKVKFSLCSIKHLAMKIYWAMEI